ncbi:hypothetical protein XV92_08820 [Vibrio metoecus]|uniref:Glycosyltransferase 2-like domain-containing protein n=1 Tax=Vibrio metoecus TaxID=1481663 RepID=A0A0Q0UE06_VIBMT|nr:glycosyltransferase family 2 protein [Vibrio metoecus]KQB01572.1 hypothetical protein XV92_08820 [Vibrio metoecus]
MKKVTIIIPSYNHQDYISNLLNQVKHLVYLCNVIIVDDASSDKSVFIINEFVSEFQCDNSIKVLLKDKNKGLVDSLRLAINHVQTEYLFMIASDDEINVESFITAIDLIGENKDNSFFLFNSNVVDQNGTFLKKAYGEKHANFFRLPNHDIRQKIFYDHPSPILLQSTIFKSSLFRKYNLIDLRLKFDDYPIFIKLFSIEERERITFKYFEDITLSKYRHHGDNTFEDYRKMYSMFLEVYRALASGSLKNKSIGLIWNLYFFRSLKSGRISDVFYFLSVKEFFIGLKYTFLFLKNKVSK